MIIQGISWTEICNLWAYYADKPKMAQLAHNLKIINNVVSVVYKTDNSPTPPHPSLPFLSNSAPQLQNTLSHTYIHHYSPAHRLHSKPFKIKKKHFCTLAYFVELVVRDIGRGVVEVEYLPWANYPVFTGTLGRHESVVSRVREVLPAGTAILQGTSLAVVSYVAVTRIAEWEQIKNEFQL